MAVIVQERKVPPSIRALSPLSDYADVFTVKTPRVGERKAEDWARAAVDDAAGLAGQFCWRAALGLRLAPRSSPLHVAGWTIADWGESWVRLEAASWLLTANIVVSVDDDALTVGTFIRYDHPLAPVVWKGLSAVHRAAMPGLLRKAVRR